MMSNGYGGSRMAGHCFALDKYDGAPNKALQATANPLRGLSAAELGR